MRLDIRNQRVEKVSMRWNILQAYCRRPSSTLTSGGARYCTGYQEAFEQVLESLMAGGDDLVESDGDKKGLDWLVEVNVLTATL